MSRILHFTLRSLSLALAVASLTGLLTAQAKKGGQGSGYGEVTVGADVHHDVSRPLRDTRPLPSPPHKKVEDLQVPAGTKGLSSDAAASEATPELVNGSTGAATTLGIFNLAGVGNYFNGPDGGFTPASTPSDATGAVGTTQYLQWVDDAFAVFSKSTGNALYGPAAGNTLWSGFGGPCETRNDGQPTVNFDKLANRWVVSQHAAPEGGPYYQCVAVSTSADATGTWNRYSFTIGSVNAAWENENAKLGVWSDGYYMGFDMYSGTTFLGAKFCALNRAQMLQGQSSGIQCIQLDEEYYSPIISDFDGTTPPPAGAPAYFAADDLNFYALDFWKFHVNWADSQDTTLSFVIMLPQPNYGIACGAPCIQQPDGKTLNPHGSHVLGRMPYRNFGSYQSLLSVENTETITTPIFYEARVTANGDLYMYQEGELQLPTAAYRFNPSIAEDSAGNIAVAYNLSNLQTWPSQYVSSRAPGDPVNTLGNETPLNPGNGSQTTPEWNQRAMLTVDPSDDCTFYYTQQYQPMDGTDNWSTQIESFTLAGCTPSAMADAAMTSPAQGSTLPGSSATFTWSAGNGPTGYQLWVGSTGAGSSNLYSSGPVFNTSFLSATVNYLPLNGETIYARLWTYRNAIWTHVDYTYTAATAPAITTPAPSGTLPGSTVTFTWSAGTVGASAYQLWIGSTGVNTNNLYSSGPTAATSVTAKYLPINGETIYARLYYEVNGAYSHIDYTYTAATQ